MTRLLLGRFFGALILACLLAPLAEAGGIERVVSPGGIEAWLIEDHSNPLISLTLGFQGGGSATDPKGQQGLSRLAAAPQPVTELLVREHYTWDLVWPSANDPAWLKQPGQFRAELNDRLVGPLYPLVFVIIAFAYLGAPRTTRQSRALSMVTAVSGVAVVRVMGFVSLVLGINRPFALSFQYIAVAIAAGLGIFAIAHGTIIEPPAFVLRAVSVITERVSRRFATT